MNTRGKVLRRVLAFVMAFAIAVSFSQSLNVEAKAKVNKVVLSKQAFSLDAKTIQDVAKPLTKGKNNVTIWNHVGTVYQGYAKFEAPKTKTYTFEFSNLKAKKSAGKVLGDVAGKRINGKTVKDIKLGPKKNMYNAQVGSVNCSVYKKNFKSKVKLTKGQTIYLYYNFTTHSKVNKITMDVEIK